MRRPDEQASSEPIPAEMIENLRRELEALSKVKGPKFLQDRDGGIWRLVLSATGTVQFLCVSGPFLQNQLSNMILRRVYPLTGISAADAALCLQHPDGASAESRRKQDAH